MEPSPDTNIDQALLDIFGFTTKEFAEVLQKTYQRGKKQGIREATAELKIQSLKEAINWLWGYMPAEQVRQIEEEEPELYVLCRAVHQEVCHER